MTEYMIERLLLRDRMGSGFGLSPPTGDETRINTRADAIDLLSSSFELPTVSPAYASLGGASLPDPTPSGDSNRSMSDIFGGRSRASKSDTDEPTRYRVPPDVKKVTGVVVSVKKNEDPSICAQNQRTVEA